MFITHVIPPPVVKSQNPALEGLCRPVQVPGVTADKRYTTSYGFNLCINNRISKEKQEVLHDLFRFIMSDPGDCWEDTKPFTPAKKSGWTDDPRVRDFPYIKEIIAAGQQLESKVLVKAIKLYLTKRLDVYWGTVKEV